MSALKRHLLMCLSVAWSLLLAPGAQAGDLLPEYTLKAGYIYNFALLTEWPSEARGKNLELCLIGNNGFGSVLETLQGKTVNDRQIDVRMLSHPGEVKGCHVLFIEELERGRLAQLKRELAGQPVLTVTDDASLAKSGIAIFLRPEQKRLVFEIDTNVTRSAQLNISARLLRLAR